MQSWDASCAAGALNRRELKIARQLSSVGVQGLRGFKLGSHGS